MRPNKILVVEDEVGSRFGIRRFLEAKGYDVHEAGTWKEAEGLFGTAVPDAVLLDYMLPDGDGVNLLGRLKELAPSVPVIMMTGHGSIELAVRAVKEGAEQFLTKPVDLPAVHVMLERLLENQRNRRQRVAGKTREDREGLDPFVGESPSIRRLAEDAQKVLPAESPVLIQGETGSGKGVLARWLHQNGPRAEEAFVDLNCAGLSGELLETDLFGHEAGAFTGATKAKIGLLEVAHKGTVFLDEIGDMELRVQPKLLTVLEEKRFRRLGDVRDRRVDIRLILATHQELGALVQERKFRSDLFFRINTLPLAVPPLRERKDDIPVLASHFLERFTAELGRGDDPELSSDALEALKAYTWPGNIRELRNVLERALLVQKRSVIGRQDLRFAFDTDLGPGLDEGVTTLLEMERRCIERALRAEGGRVDRVARRLAISKSSLYQKIKKFGIDHSKP
jgi:DNA-binding NtrC family response regulator